MGVRTEIIGKRQGRKRPDSNGRAQRDDALIRDWFADGSEL